jgi:hypothetical protein
MIPANKTSFKWSDFYAAMFFFMWMLMPLTSFSQTTERYFSEAPSTSGSASAVLDSHIFVNQEHANNPGFLNSDVYIKKLRFDLSTADSVNLKALLGIFASSWLTTVTLKNCSGQNIDILLNEYYPDTNSPFGSGYFRSHIARLDTDLSLKWHYRTSVDSINLSLVDMECDNSRLILSGTGTRADRSWSRYLLALDSTGTVTDLYANFQDSTPGYFSHIDVLDGKYYVAMSDFQNSSGNKLIIFDSSLSIVDTIDILDKTQSYYLNSEGFVIDRQVGNPLHISTGYNIITKPNLMQEANMVIAVSEIGADNEILQIDTLTFSGYPEDDTSQFNNPTPSTNALDYSTTDTILLVIAGKEFQQGYGPGMYGSNPVYIYNYNAEDRQLNWMKVYDNGERHTSISFVSILPGNQYLVGLNEYTGPQYPRGNLSLHLMVLNSRGDILGERTISSSKDVIPVYPNPFQKAFTLDLSGQSLGQVNYFIYNSSGQLVDSGVTNGERPVSPALDSGAYLLQIIKDGALLGTSQIVKQP